MKRALLLLLCTISANADTFRNDDSCDISVLPAATLLLPYFEVDLDDPGRETTLFTVTNVTNFDRVARVTLWTDSAYPVISFNVYLTGYDVQSINLFDVIARGVVAPDAGTGTAVRMRRGQYSDENASLDLSLCARLPGTLPAEAITRMQSAFTTGEVADCNRVGSAHAHAIGYATIDVVANCSSHSPADAAYWSEDLRFDNALIGDYQQIAFAAALAQGGPLVHIRAIPEGGTPASRRALAKYDAGFPRTFYSRYQSASAPRLDGRQPLPSTFAAQWRPGTTLKIWREGKAATTCADYGADLRVTELVLFDEDENGTSTGRIAFDAVSELSFAEQFPTTTGAGWLYLNLDHTRGDGFASQNWVIASSRSANGLATDVEVTALGTGCSPPAPTSGFTAVEGPPIEPAPPDDSCDITLLPAATLLLPYFEVNLEDPNGERTFFTVTNVSAQEHFAHVTLWTDWGYPVLDFNIRLAPYDTHTVDLYDTIARGLLGTASCAGPAELTPAITTAVQHAFTLGRVGGVGPLTTCNPVGRAHDNAVGYATIDVVRTCDAGGPATPDYWRKDIAYDNVLIGDSRQVRRTNDFAEGGPLVHVRALADSAKLPRTFYGTMQSPRTPRLDARQPLPSVFAARWVQGGSSGYQTSLKVWREKVRPPGSCADYPYDGGISLGEIIRFDDAENAVAHIPYSRVTPLTLDHVLPLTSLTSVTDNSIFPQLANGAISGWAYVNLDDTCFYGTGQCTFPANAPPNQAWVVVSMHAAGGFAVDTDAAALGNGCSPPAPASEAGFGVAIIGPAR